MIYDFKYKYKPEEKILIKTPFIYNKLNNLLSKNGKNQKLKIKTTSHLKKNLRLKNSKIRLKSFFLITLSKFKPLVFYKVKKLKRRTIIFPKLLNQIEKKKLALR
ncbi:MAG: hypothetical protein CMF42_01570 [Legionellales bacterium]|nr:hypothetical protein [Legionellales bacterium]|tara:strand:- start:2263 stop:2577 length:315 start_codon:yes stop_codon:yes gene_type:complete